MKRTVFSLLQDANFSEANFLDAGLVDPCVFPVCTAYKVVHCSEYQNFSSISPHILIFLE